MRRVLWLVAGAALLAAAAVTYHRLAREQAYRRLLVAGERALAADRTFEAIEAFSGALALKSDSVLACLRRGEAYRRQGQLVAAERDIRQAWQLDRSSPRPLELLGDLQLEVRNYGRAAERYADYLRLDDRSPRVLYKLALARYHGGDAQGAIAPLRQALALDSRMAEACYLLGLCLRRVGAPADAERAFEQTLGLDPRFLLAREELADLYRDLDRPRDELGQLEALLDLDPRAVRFAVLGLAYARAGRMVEAVETLRDAAGRYAGEPVVYLTLARVWLDVAQRTHDRVALGKALEALQATPPEAAASSEADLLLGRAWLLAGKIDLAEQALQRAAARYPLVPEALSYLAEAAERLGHLREARRALIDYDALVGPTEGNFVARARRIAEWSMRLGEPATAVRWLTRARDAVPTNVGLLARLAEAQLAAGDRAAARETLRRALELNPRDRTLAALARRLP